MSQKAISISRLAWMSDAERRAFFHPELPPLPVAQKPKPRHIEIDDIPNAAQAALVSMAFDNISHAYPV